MRKLLIVSLVLVVASTTFSADGAKKVAPDVKITPYGEAQFRFRVDAESTTPATGDKSSSLNYYNQLGYALGLKAKLGKKLFAQLQISNDYIATEAIGNSSHAGWKDHHGSNIPYFSLAFAKWMPADMFNLSAGIIPMKAHGSLDMIGASIFSSAPNTKGTGYNYAGAAHTCWGPRSNNSIAGIQMAFPVLRDDFKLSFEYTASIIDGRKQAKSTESPMDETVKRPEAIMSIVNVPVSVGPATITPQLVVITNRLWNDATNKSGTELAAGLDFNVKAGKKVSVRGRFAYAQIDNSESMILDTTVNVLNGNDNVTSGILGGVGVTVKAGPGAIKFDALFNTNDPDKDTDEDATTFLYFDAKYAIKAAKGFCIVPRFRVFPTLKPDESSTLKIRPELIFKGKF